jgi:hypothetical protein
MSSSTDGTISGSQDPGIKIPGNFDALLLFNGLTDTLNESTAPAADSEMLVEDLLTAAFDQTVEVIGNQRIQRKAAQHFSRVSCAEDSLLHLDKDVAIFGYRGIQLVTDIDRLADIIE